MVLQRGNIETIRPEIARFIEKEFTVTLPRRIDGARAAIFFFFFFPPHHRTFSFIGVALTVHSPANNSSRAQSAFNPFS